MRFPTQQDFASTLLFSLTLLVGLSVSYSLQYAQPDFRALGWAAAINVSYLLLWAVALQRLSDRFLRYFFLLLLAFAALLAASTAEQESKLALSLGGWLLLSLWLSARSFYLSPKRGHFDFLRAFLSSLSIFALVILSYLLLKPGPWPFDRADALFSFFYSSVIWAGFLVFALFQPEDPSRALYGPAGLMGKVPKSLLLPLTVLTLIFLSGVSWFFIGALLVPFYVFALVLFVQLRSDIESSVLLRWVGAMVLFLTCLAPIFSLV